MTHLRPCGGQLPDEALVERARSAGGDNSDYLDRLLERHRPSIFRRCLSILGDWHDADDVTQEVLLRVVRGLDGYQGRSSFSTWLHTIVQHECWTFSARRGRQSIPEDVRAKIELHFGAEIQDHTKLISRRQLPRVLAEIPHQAREILQLRYFRGLPIPQIATLLGTSLSATKMRLYRALCSSQNLMSAMSRRSRSAHTERAIRPASEHRRVDRAPNARRYASPVESSASAERRYSA